MILQIFWIFQSFHSKFVVPYLASGTYSNIWVPMIAVIWPFLRCILYNLGICLKSDVFILWFISFFFVCIIPKKSQIWLYERKVPKFDDNFAEDGEKVVSDPHICPILLQSFYSSYESIAPIKMIEEQTIRANLDGKFHSNIRYYNKIII